MEWISGTIQFVSSAWGITLILSKALPNKHSFRTNLQCFQSSLRMCEFFWAATVYVISVLGNGLKSHWVMFFDLPLAPSAFPSLPIITKQWILKYKPLYRGIHPQTLGWGLGNRWYYRYPCHLSPKYLLIPKLSSISNSSMLRHKDVL